MRKLYSLIVLFTIVLLSSCAKDEINMFGNIYGVVLNSNTAEPIQGARVTLTPTGKSTVTGNDGSYEFVDLEAGSYKVTIKIKNLGNSGNIDWTITNIPSWLTVSPSQGSTGVGKETAVALSLNSSFADKGEQVIIVNAAGESVSIRISADITSEGETGGDGDGGEGETSDDYSSATVTSCDPDIELAITSCKRSGSNVIFKYYVINNKPNDIEEFRTETYFGGTNPSQISDDQGTIYKTSNVAVTFGGESWTPSITVQLLKGVKTQGEIQIKEVPEDAKQLSVIKLKVRCNNQQYNFLNDFLDFRNVPIY